MTRTRVVRRRFAHMLRTIPPQSTERVGAFNAYTCPAGHVTVTIDRDAGVTPAFISCPHEEMRGNQPVAVACEDRASSSWYRLPADVLWARMATHEWYRPDDAERRKLDRGVADHVNRGGLLIRRIEGDRA